MPQSSILSYIARTSTNFPSKITSTNSDAACSTAEPPDHIQNDSVHEYDDYKNILTTVSEVVAESHVASQLPDNVRIEPVNTAHLVDLKRLTSTTLPIRYPDRFFLAAIEEVDVQLFSRVVLHDGRPVGWIRCRLDPVPGDDATQAHNQIYIQAMCLLAPYRGQGFASALLSSILEPHLLEENKIRSVYAHVWESNEDALGWYIRQNFRKVLLVDEYYRRLKPSGAWIVKRDL